MADKTFGASFTAIGNTVTKKILGIFESVNEESEAIVKLNQFGSKPVSIVGYITNNGIPIPNVRVSFIKDYVVNDKTNLEYSGSKVIWDCDITDNDGKYIVFINPGIYTIRIDGGKYSNYYTGQVIEQGLNDEYYYTVDGLIESRCEDTITIYGTNKKIVSGIIIDEYDKPINDAEIIISSGEEVITFIKTDDNGRYSFGIENGTYDIRIRAKNQNVSITRNFKFEDGKGFFTDNIKTGI